MQRKKRIHLILPLNYICLRRPKNTGDVPRSARSSAEKERERERGGRRQGRPVGGVNRQGRKRKEERQEEDSRSISELGKRAKMRREQSHFQLARETTWAGGLEGCRAPLPFVLLWFLSLPGDFGREKERESKKGKKERPRGYLRL